MNKAFQAAFRNGARARSEGRPRTACPYPDIRNDYRNGNTFSRAFRNAWHEGWDNPHTFPGETRSAKLHHPAPRSETPQ
jgi:hypothetical protein